MSDPKYRFDGEQAEDRGGSVSDKAKVERLLWLADRHEEQAQIETKQPSADKFRETAMALRAYADELMATARTPAIACEVIVQDYARAGPFPGHRISERSRPCGKPAARVCADHAREQLERRESVGKQLSDDNKALRALLAEVGEHWRKAEFARAKLLVLLGDTEADQ